MKDLIQIVLDEINKEMQTGYSLKDVYMVFDREMITNEVDNANIELINAQRKQTEVNTLIGVKSYIGDQKVLDLIGDELDIDVTDVDLSTLQQATIDLNSASDQLINEENIQSNDELIT
jgi:uncharacterized protein YcbK (DUF882 family)